MAGIKYRKDAQSPWEEIPVIQGPKGEDGKDYVLTDEDKQEIAELVKENNDLIITTKVIETLADAGASTFVPYDYFNKDVKVGDQVYVFGTNTSGNEQVATKLGIMYGRVEFISQGDPSMVQLSVLYASTYTTADKVWFDKRFTGLKGDNVQEALFELADDAIGSEQVQDMIDESLADLEDPRLRVDEVVNLGDKKVIYEGAMLPSAYFNRKPVYGDIFLLLFIINDNGLSRNCVGYCEVTDDRDQQRIRFDINDYFTVGDVSVMEVEKMIDAKLAELVDGDEVSY